MKASLVTKLLLVAATALSAGACSLRSLDGRDDSPTDEHSDDHGRSEHGESESAHAGHDHEGEEISDLDRQVEELFDAKCEHEIKTHECDECRYEVGVVKADASLFEGGLLSKAKARRRSVSLPLHLTAEVGFDERLVAHVSTQAEGIIRKVHVTLGDRVEKDQALVEIESVSIGEAQADYLESQGLLKLAGRNHDRLAALRKEGISSEKELLEAKQQLDAAKIQADASMGKLMRLGMSRKAVRSLNRAGSSGRLVLRAPSDGTVLEMHAVAGEIARADTSLFTVGDNSAMWVWADLYESDIALVTREQAKQPLPAVVEVKAFPGEEFKGTVDFVSPSMSESSRTVKLRIDVPNPDGRLMSGMFAHVKLFVAGDEQALTVPGKALVEDDGRAFVFVHHDRDYFVRREVSVGRVLAGFAEITQGLTGDEVVVGDGAFLLKSDVLRSKMGAGCAD